jgi:hypothetical protein
LCAINRLLSDKAVELDRKLKDLPGRHAVVIVARGFRPYVARFAADPSFPVRIRVALAPE